MNDLLQQLNDNNQTLQKSLRQQEELVFKAMHTNDPEVVLRGNLLWDRLRQANSVATGSQYKTHFIHPHDTIASQGWHQRRSGITPDGLRRMAAHPIINAIIGTRVEQVAEFCRPQIGGRGIGFVIRKRVAGGRRSQDDLAPKEHKIIDSLTEFVLNCGIDNNRWDGDSFEEFIRKVVIDSMTIDAMTFETIYSANGKPIEFVATDGATFRFIDQVQFASMYPQEKVDGHIPKYAQVIDNQQVAWFYPWELCYGVRNPQTNIRTFGYGRSELEVLINTVTYMLYADTYNGKFFSQGAAPKGFFKVSGHISDSQLQQFRQQWTSMMTGVHQSWRTPVIESEGLEWIDLQKNNRDMEFAKWQEYLIKIACATFKMDPREVGFDVGGGGGGGGPLIESGQQAFLQYSKDKGLRPLVRFLEAKINKFIISQLAPGYEFAFTGLDEQSEQQELELDLKRATTFMSLKEIRRKYNLPESVDDNDVILSPTYLQWLGHQQQAQMQMQMQPQFQESDYVDQLDDDDDLSDNPMYKALESEFGDGRYNVTI